MVTSFDEFVDTCEVDILILLFFLANTVGDTIGSSVDSKKSNLTIRFNSIVHMSSRVGKNREYHVSIRGPKSQCGEVNFGGTYSASSVGKGIALIDWEHIR